MNKTIISLLQNSISMGYNDLGEIEDILKTHISEELYYKTYFPNWKMYVSKAAHLNLLIINNFKACGDFYCI